MKIKDAISAADEMRPNAISEKIKAKWVQDLNAQLAETMGIEPPIPVEWPEDGPELLMPAPHDEIYQLYLMARIDYSQEDMELYQMDSAMSDKAISDARAWWRRNNRPACDGNWKVM